MSRVRLRQAGYPMFSIFASAAVAPWYSAAEHSHRVRGHRAGLAIWVSPGRRWFVYFLASMALLDISAHINIKRVIFLVPWLFLAIGVAACGEACRYPRMAISAAGVLMVRSWLARAGSGKTLRHTNLHEPWGRVAEVVAQDARNGAMVVSENYPFLLLSGLPAGSGSGDRAVDRAISRRGSLSLARMHLMPDEWKTWADQTPRQNRRS